jgi:hypothetical protein
MDLERRIRNLLDPMTGTGMDSGELLNSVITRLVERLYFADFRVAEQTRLIGTHEVTQVVAIKAGPVIGSGLAIMHRIEVPETLDQALPYYPGAPIDQAIWSLVHLVSLIDLAGQISRDRFIRPLYLVVSWGPVELTGACSVELLSEAARPPEWCLISAPTGGRIVEEQPGLLRLRLRPNKKLAGQLSIGLKGGYVQWRRLPFFRGQIHPFNDNSLNMILEMGDEDCGIHALRSTRSTVQEGAQIIVSSTVGFDSEQGDGDVEDGTLVGPDMRPFLCLVSKGVSTLKETEFNAGVADLPEAGDDDGGGLFVHVQYESKFDVPTTMERVVSAFQGEDGLGLNVELVYSVPPVHSGFSVGLRDAMTEAGCSPGAPEICTAEAGWFAEKKIQSLVFGPGVVTEQGKILVDEPALDHSACAIESVIERLILSQND